MYKFEFLKEKYEKECENYLEDEVNRDSYLKAFHESVFIPLVLKTSNSINQLSFVWFAIPTVTLIIIYAKKTKPIFAIIAILLLAINFVVVVLSRRISYMHIKYINKKLFKVKFERFIFSKYLDEQKRINPFEIEW